MLRMERGECARVLRCSAVSNMLCAGDRCAWESAAQTHEIDTAN